MIYIPCLQQLQIYSLEQLNALWEEIADQTSVRMGYIKVLDSQLWSIENDRVKMVKQPYKFCVSLTYKNTRKIIIKRLNIGFCFPIMIQQLLTNTI